MSELARDAGRRFRLILDRLRSAVQELREECDLDEDFDLRVIRYWLDGLAKARNAELYKLLAEKYGPRREIADFLGLKDPRCSFCK